MKNGDPIDPYHVLDISIFPKKEQLPVEYRVKHVQDYLAREVNLANQPRVVGDTIEERRDDFLYRYAQ